jgi:hypothetical protein
MEFLPLIDVSLVKELEFICRLMELLSNSSQLFQFLINSFEFHLRQFYALNHLAHVIFEHLTLLLSVQIQILVPLIKENLCILMHFLLNIVQLSLCFLKTFPQQSHILTDHIQ